MAPVFILLSFEGPDPYSLAGGLGSRVAGLSETLAKLGFGTHLFFVGDPDSPGLETAESGRLRLHRWCQWISRYHPAGVYDGEEGKLRDWNRSLPPWLESHVLEPGISRGDSFVVLGEEWHTAESIAGLRDVVNRRGWQDSVQLLWNANNTYSFDRIDWRRLRDAAHITTVSRYMKQAMWPYEVDARVIPNGIPESWLDPVDRKGCRALSRLFRDRVALLKVARWHPDKRWNMAVDAVAHLKGEGLKPLFLARGGMEPHRDEVLARARQHGLVVRDAGRYGTDIGSLFHSLASVVYADVVVMQSALSEAQRKALYHSATAVLANSGAEPFGLVGLEAMAVGGLAFVGSTGEDYVTPGHDAIALQTDDPGEIVHRLLYLLGSREEGSRIRQAARRTARRYTWRAVIQRVLLPCLREIGVPFPAERVVEANAQARRGRRSRPGGPSLDLRGVKRKGMRSNAA